MSSAEVMEDSVPSFMCDMTEIIIFINLGSLQGFHEHILFFG